MYVIVKYGADEEVVFNPECKAVSLLDEIKCKCNIERWAEIELSDQQGNLKDLRTNLNKYASEYLKDKEIYILLLVETKPKGLVKYTPLIDDSLLSTEFLAKLETKQQRGNGRNSRADKRSNSKLGGKLSARKPSRQGSQPL